MAISGSIVGRETAAWYKQATGWGTEAAGVGEELLMLADGMSVDQKLDAVPENNAAFLREADLGAHTANLNFRSMLRFDDLRGIAQALGSAAYATVEELHADKGDYRHRILPAQDNYGDIASIALKKGSIIQTFPGVKFAGFTISGQASPNRIEVTYTTVADRLRNDSAVITASAFGAMSANPTGSGGRAFFRNFSLLLNDQSAATLDAGDALSNAITSFEFSFQRSLVSDFTNDSGLVIEEPVEDGYPEATLTLQFRNLDAGLNDFYSDWLGKTAKKLQFSIDGGPASAATGDVAIAQFTVEAPRALVEKVDFGPYSGPGRISGSVSLRFYAADSDADAPGMAFTQPFRVTAVNGQSARAIG